MLVLLAVASACAGSEENGQSTPDADESSVAERRSEALTPLAPGEVGALRAMLSGTKDTTYQGSTADGSVEFFGSCDDDVPLRVGFNVKDSDGNQVARFQGRTDRMLEPGQTGSFPVETATAWYKRMGLPSRMTFEGRGNIEISLHDARRGSRRMTGVLMASGLEDSRGDLIDVEVEFDVGLSCGLEE